MGMPPDPQRLSFSQFIDFLLWGPYVRERFEGGGQFFDLNQMAETLHDEVEPQWLFDAAKVMESRGLARCLFALGGYTSAMPGGQARIVLPGHGRRLGGTSEHIGDHARELYSRNEGVRGHGTCGSRFE